MQLTLERKKQLAMLTLVIGALVWVPTLLKVPSPLWLLSFPQSFCRKISASGALSALLWYWAPPW